MTVLRSLQFFIAVVLMLASVSAYADDRQLADLDLEDLMEVEVVTASRRAEPLSQVAGAVTVLDEEDIFRSGATSIPDVLKLVPGVHVARIDTDKWAVGVRGFNGLLSNKHLVLLDGRPITSPTTAGVNWNETIPVSLIKRIEVVRGTWTSLWGAESFTGVINIITKTAEELSGGQSVTLVGTTGVEEMVRFGAEVGETTHVMGYGKGTYKTGNWLSGDGGDKSSRNWTTARGGFRVDWENAFTDAFSLQGDIIGSHIEDGASSHDVIHPPKKRNTCSGYGQFVWDRATGLDAGIRFRTSYSIDGIRFGDFRGDTNSVDAELQYAAEQAGVHRLTWGVGTRYYWDNLSGGDNSKIDRVQMHTMTASAFVQDRITLSPDSLYLFLGSKFDYLGVPRPEIQPTIRLLHTRADSEYWLAVSRGVRSDTRFQRSGSYTIDNKGRQYTVVAPGNLNTEQLIAYEAGYRHVFSEAARFEASLYVNDYDKLIMFEFDDATNTATLNNTLKGTAYGLESLYEWKATDWLTVQPSFSLIYQNIYGFDLAPTGESMPEKGLGSEVKLQVMTQPTSDVGFDVFVGYLDSPDSRKLPGYLSLEAHASWQATEALMLELIGKNLDGAHEQFSKLRVGPSLDLRMTWDF